MDREVGMNISKVTALKKLEELYSGDRILKIQGDKIFWEQDAVKLLMVIAGVKSKKNRVIKKTLKRITIEALQRMIDDQI